MATATKIANIADRAAGYGFPGEIVDGNDVVAVRDVAVEGVARARSGEGPTLIEAKSFRITQHSAATKTDLRPSELLDSWRERDPILRVSRFLADAGVAEERLVELEEQARREVEEAVEFALASPRPEPGQELEDVYAPAPWLTPGRLA